MVEGGRQMAEGKRRKADSGSRMADGGRRKANGGKRMVKGRRLKAEGGRRDAEGGKSVCLSAYACAFLLFLYFSTSYSNAFFCRALPFWAADPKGTISYRTEGGVSVCLSVCPSEQASK